MSAIPTTDATSSPHLQSRQPVFSQICGLLGWLMLCFAAAGIGSYFTMSEIPTWYAGLNKPSWNPPNWVFGPVWTTLYLMMGTAMWIVWRSHSFPTIRFPIAIFVTQLLLNSLWSIIFFTLHNPALAFCELLLLWIAIALTMKSFWPFSRLAAVLLIPYLCWVSFAGVLNFTIWQLN